MINSKNRDKVIIQRLNKHTKYIESDEFKRIQEFKAWKTGRGDIIDAFYASKGARVGMKQWGNFRIASNKKMHIPMASEISRQKGIILFAEATRFNTEDKQLAKDIQTLIKETNLNDKFIEGASTASALGSVFMKPVWRKDVKKFVSVGLERPDVSISDNFEGDLVDVTFIKYYEDPENAQMIYRLAETYTSKGEIWYDLYKGTTTQVGEKANLDEIAETSGLADFSSGLEKCLAIQLKNPFSDSAKNGISDYDRLIPLFDSLDFYYSSWRVEVEVSKARLSVPAHLLPVDKNNRAIGAFEDEFLIKMFGDTEMEGSPSMFQPLIRSDGFKTALESALELIIILSGFSTQTFGLKSVSGAEAGISLAIRQKKTFDTKAVTERKWKTHIEALVENVMHLQYKVFDNKSVGKIDINVEFNDTISNDLQTQADAMQKIFLAECTSTETRVRELHGDWTNEQVLEEVAKIDREKMRDMMLTYGKILPDGVEYGDEHLDMIMELIKTKAVTGKNKETEEV